MAMQWWIHEGLIQAPLFCQDSIQKVVNVDKSSPHSSQVLKDSCCSLPLDNNYFRAYTDSFDSLLARLSPGICLKWE